MTWLAVSGDAGRGCGFRGVNFGFPPGVGALFGAGVQGYLGAVVGDAEVGVLDVDGDDLLPRQSWQLLIAGGSAGFLLAAIYGIALLISGRATRKQQIPFGPFMIAGGFLVILAGT